ncbi:MAG: ion channel [Parasphingorhabdus sp.]|nr:ion channel [Parasphingorhabdus sp.]
MTELIIPLIVSALLVATCLYLHFRVLRYGASKFATLQDNVRNQMLAIMAAIFLTHMLEVIIFAIAYWAIAASGAGYLAGAHASTAADYFYFSIASYTTLGIGDITPMGAMRLVAGIEALTGLLLIAWSASFTYLSMERIWSPDKA